MMKEEKRLYLFQIMLFLFLMLLIRDNSAQLESEQVFMRKANLSIHNYTSCEDFVANSTFDPKSVIDVDWKIFYFWTNIYEESYTVRFSLPTKVLVERYQVELTGEVFESMNWSNAVLFMESSIDFSALFIASNISGVFTIIPSLAFEYNKLSLMTFAMKVVEPGYLGIVNCKFRVCYALAPVNKMPEHDHMEQEAKKLGFWNDFGHTHTEIPTSEPPNFYEPVGLDDDDEDEHMGLLHNENLQVF